MTASAAGMQIRPVVLCGGSGTRLWPLSRSMRPKQLLALVGNETLFQSAVRRNSGPMFHAPTIVTSEDLEFAVGEQLDAISVDPEVIVLEPVARNTAAAIGLAACLEARSCPDRLLLVVPSDHVIGDGAKFCEAVETAIRPASDGRLVTFGIRPTRPATEYGYVEADDPAAACSGVKRFTEKPDLATAERFLSGGACFWNSGMFLFCAHAILEELRALAPEVAAACEEAVDRGAREGQVFRPLRQPLLNCPSTSIDHAVMEHTDRASVVPVEMSWSDVGSWDALWDISDRDEQSNCFSGDVVALDTRGSLIKAEGDVTIAAVGVENLVVVATRDAVLVTPRDRSQDVGRLVDAIRETGTGKETSHGKVVRPWGSYEIVDGGIGFQTKRVIVKPGGKLSLQKHHKRAEHWIVVGGTARVTIDGNERLLQENESAFVPVGAVHRLENPGNVPLHIVEVQYGEYLGEDDIVRFEDRYGRSD